MEFQIFFQIQRSLPFATQEIPKVKYFKGICRWVFKNGPSNLKREMDEVDDNSSAVLEWSRFYVQKVFVPILLCIGLVGNTITVMVLTRRRMRSSTNTYLSALAIADIIQLIFGFLLSFEHDDIHDKKYELYWRFYGLTHWLCDAANGTSVWLAVSFTVERYIAVCFPMKGKVFCTERRAKSIIVIVYIFCLVTTATTAFEYQLAFDEDCIEKCPSASSTRHASDNEPSFQNIQIAQTSPIYTNCSNHSQIIIMPIFLQQIKTSELRLPKRSLTESFRAGHNVSERPPSELLDGNVTDIHENGSLAENVPCCVKNLTVRVEQTELGKSKIYTDFIYWYSAVFFTIIPLALIATFNCFLVRAVYMSQKMRRVMTNSQDSVSFTNEKRITIMLISIVFIFIFCQTPTACHLIYSHFHRPKTRVEKNVMLILGNFFNMLVMSNAPLNFLIYCLLSKKFRSTFRKIFWTRRTNGSQIEAETILLSPTKGKDRFNPYTHGLIKRNASEYQRTPRNLETQSLTSIPRSRSLMTRPVGKARSSDLNV
ncbi:hypothetical protein JTB14_022609 [Gonioctena quinquepunctata]|nr:hypothetical protein JTB14_022609 [Gonioctena quinquepunctata]